tara:strand:- start:56 stop:466 length:411 start_codon:yes stop_codon:yes gene_type:complete
MDVKDLAYQFLDNHYKIEKKTVLMPHNHWHDGEEENELEELFGTTEVAFEDWVEDRIGMNYRLQYLDGTIEFFEDGVLRDDWSNPAIIHSSGEVTFYYRGRRFYHGYPPSMSELERLKDDESELDDIVDEYYRKNG